MDKSRRIFTRIGRRWPAVVDFALDMLAVACLALIAFYLFTVCVERAAAFQVPACYATLRDRLNANSIEQRLHPVNKDKPWTAKPCRIWRGTLNSAGYATASVRQGDKVKKALAHRLSLADALGVPVSALLIACHHCDTKPCIEPSHLVSQTQSANVRDCMAKGRYVSGLGRLKIKNHGEEASA